MEIGYYPSATRHYRERLEGSDDYILIYCITGKGIVEISGRRLQLSQNEVFCIPRDTFHRYYTDELKPWTILWLHFSTQYDHWGLSFGEIIPINNKARGSAIQHHFIELMELGGRSQSASTVICASQLLRLLLAEVYLLSDGHIEIKQNQYLSKSIKIMSEYLNQTLTMTDLADSLQISVSYLLRIFKKFTGQAPIDYFINLKMERACKY